MGAQNSSGSGSSQSYNLAYNKEKKCHEFIRQAKEENGEYREIGRFDEMVGYLKEIRVERKQKRDGTGEIPMMKIVLRDNVSGENIWISAFFDGATRAMLNCLAGCREFKLLKFTCRYWGKEGADKNARVFVDNGGDKTSWAYEPNQIPKTEYTRNKKDEIVDTDATEVNNFFIEVIKNDIMPKVAPVENQVQTTQPETSSYQHTTNDVPSSDYDSLPF